MALTMNEESKNTELKKLLCEQEKYRATTWGNIVSTTPRLLSYAVDADKRPNIGFRNIYCYVGLTKTSLHIVTLHSLDVTRATEYFRIPLQDIQGATVRKGVLKSSVILSFGNEKFKILWFNEATGTDMKKQRAAVRRICDYFIDISKHENIRGSV